MKRRDFTKWMSLAAASAALPLPFGCSPHGGHDDAEIAGGAMTGGPDSRNIDPRSPEGFDTPLRVPGYRNSLLRIVDRPHALTLAPG